MTTATTTQNIATPAPRRSGPQNRMVISRKTTAAASKMKAIDPYNICQRTNAGSSIRPMSCPLLSNVTTPTKSPYPDTYPSYFQVVR